MHRLLVASACLELDSPALSREAARHLKVLRPETGEEIELFDGKGNWRIYRFLARGGFAAASPKKSVAAPEAGLTLFACITKGSRWDWTIEKATELGVARIVPVVSDRTIVRIPVSERAAKRERWLRIAEDAARQSDAKWLPEISEAVDFEDALALAGKTSCFIGALTNPPSPPLLQAIERSDDRTGKRFSVFIGPEGDFTPEELAALMKVATPTSFGPTVLRAETAALFALSVLAAAGHGRR